MDTIETDNIVIKNQISLAKAALVAGLGLLLMALTVPFAEFYIFPELISDDVIETMNNVLSNKMLFTISIFLHFITLICDIIVAWALYIFLKPVMKNFSLLTSWFRLIYTAMYLIALTNLIKILSVVEGSGTIQNNQFADSIMFYFNSFQLEWSFGLVIFGIYLLFLGYLVCKSSYVPNIFGILLLIAGFGYLTHTLGTFFVPSWNLDFLFFTFFGELIFMIWLLVKGRKIDSIIPA
ncbi:hypothetical protein ATO12_20755 [Aquimarina atlantica]|uniref:DUF4386 domain-containing protein n=1 Tax=Aquimarina atlantica TaxID=1317122 RepID=A0A023BS07_9FLAO|nr:DUF4386 domain-containing protein [Aquimarina atlantica]EZH72568.1 hypothetical protein ATO12_20755 [Aquimarina atlantica]